MPIAQTGSYATTMFPQWATSTWSAIAFSYLAQTSNVFPDSLSSNISPMQAITFIPFSNAILVFNATSLSLSWKRVLLSE